MVEAITLERAIAEKATADQMLAIANWHDEHIAAMSKGGKRPKNYEAKVSHHRYVAKAMRRVAKGLEAAGAPLEVAA